jgi:O-antigen ligase
MFDFENITKNTKTLLRRELVALWIFSVILSCALVVLSLKNKFPLGKGDFVFLSILTLLISLYRPRWTFFLFIGLIPLENIVLVSGFLPMQLRPYQFLGVILMIAVAILFASRRLNFKILRPLWRDYLIFSLVPFSFLSIINASNKNISFKNSLILLSFVILYFLIRNFVRSKKDLLKTAFFFAGSYLVVSGYGFYQVLADKFGLKSFEVMFGRPNSVFVEPDWLGVYLCFVLAVFLSAIYYYNKQKLRAMSLVFVFYGLVFLNIILIILTLSRSAWVGAAVVFIIFAFLSSFEKKEKVIMDIKGIKSVAVVLLIVLLSLLTIWTGRLSKFDIFDRARSTATSEQKITIACEKNSQIPESVVDVEDLLKYGCRHINLEDISLNKSQGKIVAETFRKDPNVLTRSLIYKKSWEEIKKHPIIGVGYGSITQVLGADPRGAGLNESNIFLQIWAGSGIFGLMVFGVFIGYFFIYSFRRVSPICPLNKIIGCSVIKDDFEKAANIFVVLGIAALIIPNLFNAGLLMGIIWLALSILANTERLRV